MVLYKNPNDAILQYKPLADLSGCARAAMGPGSCGTSVHLSGHLIDIHVDRLSLWPKEPTVRLIQGPPCSEEKGGWKITTFPPNKGIRAARSSGQEKSVDNKPLTCCKRAEFSSGMNEPVSVHTDRVASKRQTGRRLRPANLKQGCGGQGWGSNQLELQFPQLF